MTWTRIAVVAAALGLASPAIAGTDEPFTATAAELRALAATAGSTDANAVVLAERGRYVFDDAGRRSFRLHRIVQITRREGLETWGSVEVGWAPWYQRKPTLRARVLTGDDRFRELDPSTIEEGTSSGGDSHSYSDWRTRRAPLPAIAPGVIVEIERELVDREPFFSAGKVNRFYFAATSVPIREARLEIDVPRGRRLRYEASLLPGLVPTIERRGARTRYVFERHDLPVHEVPSSLPPDAPRVPVVAFTLGRSWSKVASSYAKVIDAQIAAGPVPDGAMPAPASTRAETIARTLAHVHRNVRYTGLEFGENAIVPWTPAETWKRGYGDCKDKATLLVAMLRRLGIDAHVALLDSGSDRDVRPKLPGLGDFDHAIVYIPGRRPVWIDATVDLARVGQLPYADQGRRALIARRGTRRLVTLPADRAGDNRIVENRRVELSSYGTARVVETARYEGLQELRWRYDYRDSKPDKLAQGFENYVEAEYGASALTSHSLGDAGDLDTTFGMVIEAAGASIAAVDLTAAQVSLPAANLGQLLPSELEHRGEGEAPHEPRVAPLDLVPHATVQRYHIVPAPGFAPTSMPRVSHRVAGPLRIVRDVERDGDEVIVTLEMAITRDVASPAEVAAMRSLLDKYWNEKQDLVRFEHRAVALANAGDLVEAIALQRKLVAAQPGAANALARLAYLLGEAGLGLESRRVARLAVAADPDEVFPQIILGDTCGSDALARFTSRGLDRACALDAYGRALKLDPDQPSLRAVRANILLRDDRGLAFAGDLAAASDELVRAVEAGAHEYDALAAVALAAAGRFAKLGEVAAKLESGTTPDVARIASLAVTRGADAAVDELAAFPRLHQKAIADEVMSTLAMSRSWEHYGALFEALRRADIPVNETVTRLVPRLGVERPAPVELFSRFIARMMFGLHPGDRELREVFATATSRAHLADPESFLAVASSFRKPLAGSELPLAVFEDLMSASVDASIVSRSPNVRRLQVSIPPAPALDLIAVREKGGFRVLGQSGTLAVLGAAALDFADSGKLADARFLLDIAAEGQPATLAPFATPVFYRLWRDPDGATRRDLRVAAAALAVTGPLRDRSMKLLEACAARGDQVRLCSEIVLFEKARDGRWDQTAAERATFADVAPGRWWLLDVARLETVAGDDEREALLAKIPPTPRALWAERRSVAAGDFDAALAVNLARVEKGGAGLAYAANQAAWLELLVTRPRLARAEKMAKLAIDEGGSSSALHTLATVQAARGDVAGAKESLAKLFDAQGGLTPSAWLIYGRIAAECGAIEAARAAYDRVIADPESARAGAISSAALATRWRAALP